jgi:hypothetical protein
MDPAIDIAVTAYCILLKDIMFCALTYIFRWNYICVFYVKNSHIVPAKAHYGIL